MGRFIRKNGSFLKIRYEALSIPDYLSKGKEKDALYLAQSFETRKSFRKYVRKSWICSSCTKRFFSNN
jgi:hypothetical protein